LVFLCPFIIFCVHFGIFCDYLVHFVIRYVFPVLVCSTKKNMATL
jgi:hypothetical protein